MDMVCLQKKVFLRKHINNFVCCLDVGTVESTLGICNPFSNGVSFEWPHQLHGILLQWPCLCMTAVSPVAIEVLLGMGPDVSKNASHSPPCNLHNPPGGLLTWGQGLQGWAQLWCTLANGTQHRWQSLILSWVFVTPWAQATFQQCALQSQMDLKMGVCRRHSISCQWSIM